MGQSRARLTPILVLVALAAIAAVAVGAVVIRGRRRRSGGAQLGARVSDGAAERRAA